MAQFFLGIGAVLAGLSVAFGAFASHALKAKLAESALAVFETGARYQMYHALGLIAIALLLLKTEAPQPLLTTAGFGFIAGTVLFSGSLYSLSLTGIKWLGAIAPLGGAAFLIGWGCLAVAAFQSKL